MPLAVLRFSHRGVDTNASHTEPVEGIKKRNVCEKEIKRRPARRTRNPSVPGLSPALTSCWICSWLS